MDAINRRFASAKDEYDKAAKALEDYFLPLLKSAIDAADMKLAESILNSIPSDSVAKVFAWDMLRQARKPS